MVKRGLPEMIGTLLSASKSNTMKSTGKINYLNADKGMRLMLAPSTQSVLPLYLVHIEHVIAKFSGSLNSYGILF